MSGAGVCRIQDLTFQLRCGFRLGRRDGLQMQTLMSCALRFTNLTLSANGLGFDIQLQRCDPFGDTGLHKGAY
jgi:hypothetical protein